MRLKDFIFIFLAFLICFIGGRAIAMQQIKVNTGYGYYSYNGQIVADYVMPPGNYSICDGLSQTEVASAQELNEQKVNSLVYQQFLKTVGCK